MVGKRLYCLKTSEASSSPSSSSSSSLRSLALKRLRSVIVELVKRSSRQSNEEANKDEQRLKARLHNELPRFLIEELYASLFAIPLNLDRYILWGEEEKTRIQLDPEIFVNENVENVMFRLWILFLDPESTKHLPLPEHEISRNFNLESVTYFSKVRTSLETVNLSYNWIVKGDYVAAFKNLPNLRHLIVGGYVDDHFLRIVSENCRLHSLSLTSENNYGYKVTVKGVSVFLSNQRDSLKELDLIPLLKSSNVLQNIRQFSEVIDSSLSCMPKLKKLTINSQLLKVLNKPLEYITEVFLYFEEDSMTLFSTVPSKFPSLERIHVFKIHFHQDDPILREKLRSIGRFITEITCVSESLNPFLVLRYLPNVEKASFRIVEARIYGEADDEDDDDNDDEDETDDADDDNDSDGEEEEEEDTHFYGKLKSLFIDASISSFSFKDFEPVILNSPRLQELTANVGHFRDFVESQFVKKLSKVKLTHLTHFKLCCRIPMTYSTILTFLNSFPKLRHLENCLYFAIDRSGSNKIRTEAEKIGLRPVYARRFGHFWRTEDGKEFEI